MLLPPCSHSSGGFWPFSLRLETPTTDATLVFCISKWQQPIWKNPLNRRLACSQKVQGIPTVTHVPVWTGEGHHFGGECWGTVPHPAIRALTCDVDGKASCSHFLELNSEAWTLICRIPCQYHKHQGGLGCSGASLSLLSVLELLFSVQGN